MISYSADQGRGTGGRAADRERRLDAEMVLALCGDEPMLEKDDVPCSMGVDTGRDLHVVIMRTDKDDADQHRVVHLGVCQTFPELDSLLERFQVDRCVIDGLPETHATREFASRHRGKVFMHFFNEHQRGAPKWNRDAQIVQVNRTEVLDASRLAIRDKKVALPRRDRLIEQFAAHMANDAKVLREDPETGVKRYRYVKTGGTDHFSLAFTYAWLATQDQSGPRGYLAWMREQLREARGEQGSSTSY